jgi:hypothetical protein
VACSQEREKREVKEEAARCKMRRQEEARGGQATARQASWHAIGHRPLNLANHNVAVRPGRLFFFLRFGRPFLCGRNQIPCPEGGESHLRLLPEETTHRLVVWRLRPLHRATAPLRRRPPSLSSLPGHRHRPNRKKNERIFRGSAAESPRFQKAAGAPE